MKSENAQLFLFSFLLQVAADYGLEWIPNTSVLFCELYNTNPLKVSWSRSDECPGLSHLLITYHQNETLKTS